MNRTRIRILPGHATAHVNRSEAHLTSHILTKEGFMDPSPDYDASDEIEYFFSWLPWALRGVYPPPAYPPV